MNRLTNLLAAGTLALTVASCNTNKDENTRETLTPTADVLLSHKYPEESKNVQEYRETICNLDYQPIHTLISPTEFREVTFWTRSAASFEINPATVTDRLNATRDYELIVFSEGGERMGVDEEYKQLAINIAAAYQGTRVSELLDPWAENPTSLVQQSGENSFRIFNNMRDIIMEQGCDEQ